MRGILVGDTTGTVTASGGTLNYDISGVPNYLNILKVKVQPSGGAGPYTVEIFQKDTRGSSDLMAKWKDVGGNIYDPMDISGGTPAEGNPSAPIVAYEDADLTGEIHLKFTNDDTIDRTYTFVIVYEEVLRFDNDRAAEAVSILLSGPFQCGSLVNGAGLASGTYDPDFFVDYNTNGTPTGSGWTYSRVGDIVSVAGQVNIDPTSGSGTGTRIHFSIPIASNFTSTNDATGIGLIYSQGNGAELYANPSDDTIVMDFLAFVGQSNWKVMLQYVVK